MDDSKAILHLSTNFPDKSEEYLRNVYQKNNRNLNATMNAVQNEKPEKKNVFGSFFENLINRFERLIGISRRTPATPTTVQSPGTSTSRDEGFFEINIGEKFAQKLQEKFSDKSLILPKGFQPVIEIPVTLGRQLYVAYVESVFRQQEAHDHITAQLIKEDEEFARKLQQADDDQGLAASTIFLKERPEYANISHQSTVDIPEYINVVAQDLEGQSDDLKKIKSDFDDETDWGSSVLSHPGTFYRDQAQEHLKKRQQLYEKAKHSFKLKDRSLANSYFQQAQQQTKLFEQANNFAAAAFLTENKERNPSKNTIDLHHLFVKEAIQALDIFLDDEICSLQNRGSESKSLMIITGRGKHSPHGIPKIKPAVMDRLRERGLRYSEINPGLLKVHIFKYSYLTNDLTGVNYY